MKVSNLDIDIKYAPGHTKSHLMYHIKSPYANKWQERPGLLDNIPDFDMYDQALFTGDNVHIGGIGRVLDGTYEDMI